MFASLHAADVNGDAAIALDDEGGASVKDSKTRFVEPAIALLALRGSFDHGEGGRLDAAPGHVRSTSVSAQGGGGFARGVSGLIGFGAIGFAVGYLAFVVTTRRAAPRPHGFDLMIARCYVVGETTTRAGNLTPPPCAR